MSDANMVLSNMLSRPAPTLEDLRSDQRLGPRTEGRVVPVNVADEGSASHDSMSEACQRLLAGRLMGSDAEQLLVELVLGQEPVRQKLHQLQAQVVAALASRLGEVRVALVLARTLREVVAATNSIAERQQDSVAVLGALRAQRLLLERRGPNGNGS